MAKDPRNLQLALQAQSDMKDVESGGKTPFTDALHGTLNQIAVACAREGLLDADDLKELGFSDPKASMSGPHPMDGGSGSNKKPS